VTRGADKRHNGKHRDSGFGDRFFGIPHSAYSSPLFVALSPWAIKLLVDLGSQYNGRNNGDLAAAWKLMKPRGWNSETTLNRCKKELIEAGFITELRKGRRPNTCSLYALTWRPLNPSPKHDFGPNGFTPYAYLKKAPVVLVVNIKRGGAGLTPPAAVCDAA
jgi:hypothetical protein